MQIAPHLADFGLNAYHFSPRVCLAKAENRIQDTIYVLTAIGDGSHRQRCVPGAIKALHLRYAHIKPLAYASDEALDDVAFILERERIGDVNIYPQGANDYTHPVAGNAPARPHAVPLLIADANRRGSRIL
ncbi:MAG: hypothetical protein ACUVX8_16245 [Candidatus Zipacnadales bacterium]